MASSGKKGKKSKGKTVTLTDFLQDTPGVPTLPVKKFNWAQEVEDGASDGYESRSKSVAVPLPTAPRAARGPDISEDRIPSQPPYIAYISNLPYDTEERDIADFFCDMNICGMRLPKDDREGGKLKGFGYVEFEDRASLVDAISIMDTNLKGRRIKIDVATNSDHDRRRGGRMDMGRDRPDRPEVSTGDWRAGPRDAPTSESRERGGGGGGGFRDRERDRDREGSESNRPGAWRDSQDRPSFREDRGGGGGGFRDSDRGGYRDSDRERGGGFSDRGRFGDRDRDDRRGGGGFGPRKYGDRDGFGTRRYGERDGFDRDRDGFRRDEGRDGPPPPSDKGEPRRKILNLHSRTLPLAEPTATNSEAEAPEQPAKSASSIFGSAKPVDTTLRDRQIEERLAKEKESKAPARDGSRDNRSAREEDDDRGSRKDWSRKRNDDYENGARKESPERRPSSRGPPQRRSDDRKDDRRDERKDDRRDDRKDDRRDDKKDDRRDERKDDRRDERKDDRKDERRDDRRGPPPRERDRAPPRKDEKPRREERPQRDNHEKEMPRLIEPEPPNFAASNKFATLEADLSE